MPRKKNFMEAKVAALELELSEVCSVLEEVQNTARTNQAHLVSMLERCLGKSIPEGDGSVNDKAQGSSVKIKSPEKTVPSASGASFNKLQGEALNEFRQSVKVELPMFDGTDSAGWISRAEVYFRVQDTTPAVKVSLAQLCMEGCTIHFFNSLLEEEGEISWENLRVSCWRYMEVTGREMCMSN
jgi:hypothetical protein